MGMLSSYIYFLFFSLLALNIQQIKNNSEKGNFPKQNRVTRCWVLRTFPMLF